VIVIFRNAGDSIMREDILEIASRLNIVIPQAVQAHYLRHNGGIPEPDCWIMENGEWHCVQAFLPMKHGRRTLESVYLQGIAKDYLARNVVPFANDAGGNYFCFEPRGRVCFYAMDGWNAERSVEENKKKATQWLANSFEEFIAGMVPNPEGSEE
jgi:hypothetical protein